MEEQKISITILYKNLEKDLGLFPSKVKILEDIEDILQDIWY